MRRSYRVRTKTNKFILFKIYDNLYAILIIFLVMDFFVISIAKYGTRVLLLKLNKNRNLGTISG